MVRNAEGKVFPQKRIGLEHSTKEIAVSCISAHDPQLERLADAIAERVGQQRFHVWFNNSTRLDLKQDGLEIAVPNDFISEWIVKHFKRPIQEAAHEVLGCSLALKFHVVPQLFEVKDGDAPAPAPPTNGKAHTGVRPASEKMGAKIGAKMGAVVAASAVPIMQKLSHGGSSNEQPAAN